MTQAATDAQKTIASFAETMEIFPLGIIANGESPRLWRERYELTFEHYRRFYEFKEFALSTSERDFVKIIEGFDSATPKEKALMMTVIYIYERVHRSRVAARRGWGWESLTVDKHFLRFDNKKTVFFETRWDEWISLIESRKNDPTVVFPAVITDEKILKMKWREDQKKAKQQLYKQLSSCDLSELYEQELYKLLPFIKLREIGGAVPSDTTPYTPSRFFQIISDKYDYEKIKPFEVYAEYFCWQYMLTVSYGTIPPSGNSSAKPKTLGDIATQILKSRLSYEEE